MSDGERVTDSGETATNGSGTTTDSNETGTGDDTGDAHASTEPVPDTLDVLVVAIDEYYYVPQFLDDVLRSDDVRVVGITAVPPTLGTQALPAFLWRLFRVFGPRVFARHATFQAKYRALDTLYRAMGAGRAYSLASLARDHGVEYRHVDDVNTEAYRSYAAGLDPDVVVSVAAPQKFEPPLLAVPDVAALNVHSSLLPEYRGVSPSFWSLLEGEDRTGVTVHYMDDGIDTGDVIVQRALPVREDDTLHSLNERVADRGSEVLAEALGQVRTGDVSPTSIDPDDGSYYSLPDRDDVRRFLERGNAFY